MSEPAGGRPLVVGVGASAGGLEAAQALLRGVPSGCGLAFVFVFHLDPAAPPLLPDILAKAGPFPAAEVGDGTPVEADRVYTAPAGTLVDLDGGVFRLAPADRPEDRRTPVDHFLHALARDQGERAVAVILSGTGSDGALGLRAVGDAGGMTLVQEPATARHDSMPQSALATGSADHVLPPDGLAAELVAYARHVHAAVAAEAPPLAEQVADILPAVCDTLLQETGHNFRHYKTSTLVRRAVRRVQVLKLPTARDYLDRLRADRAEADQLFKDLLIGVTAFFRDPEAFGVLADEVLPRLVSEGGPHQPLRVWVPGCATGEEAYTLAMLVRERLDGLPAPPEVQVFATDIDERALAFARQGVYPLGVADEVGPDRLKRFFVKKGQQYHVSKELRETVLFSVHNLINDPPFSRLDLVSCRNLLIYLGSHLQQKLIPLFHYALRAGGYLFLGPSENLSGHQELFRPVDAKARISQRLATAIRPAGGGLAHVRGGPPPAARPPNAPAPAEADTYLVMQRIVLDEFAPKAAVVTEDGQVVCASGNLEKYLTVAAGAFHNKVTRLAREGLRVGLRAALAEAARVRRRVDHDGLSLRTEAGVQRVMVTVQPMPQMGEDSGLFMVVFQDIGPVLPRGDEGGHAPAGEDAAALIEQLERELATTREDLERAVQELEAANEELKSSNEELLSMNEELQSANEELETSKEEVQAANATLTGVNADLENILAGTRIATLFLDDAGNLRRVTPSAAAIYNVVPSDAGRPLAHFTHKVRRMPPLPDAAVVRAAPWAIEDEVETLGGAWYVRRVLPYRTPDGRADGLVVAFIDITERKRFEDRLKASERVYRAVGESIDYGVWVCAPDGRNTYASESFLKLVGLTQEECSGTGWGAVLHPDDAERTVAAWKECVRTGGHWDIEHRFKGADGAWHPVLARGLPVKDAAGQVLFWAGINLDIAAQKRAVDALRDADRRKDEFLATLAHELRNPLAPIRNGLRILQSPALKDDDRRRTLDIMARQLGQLVHLVDDLLDVSRVSRGKITLRRQPVDLRQAVEAAAEAARPGVEAAGLALAVGLPDGPLALDADPTRLAQVFANLLNNAAKYTDRGGRVELSVARDGGDAVVTVRDTGIGIPADMLAKVFDMFTQVGPSLDRSQGGLGIGLTLVRRLVELHGGTVAAASDGPGAGSTFTVRLQLAAAPEPDAATAPPARPPGRRILVVDDNVDAAESLAMILGFGGHEVRTAHAGPAALDAAASFRPAVVFLDIGLPGMDGYEVARHLRLLPGLRGVVLVALTGWGSDGDRLRSSDAGFDHHLTKPVDAARLNDLVARITSNV